MHYKRLHKAHCIEPWGGGMTMSKADYVKTQGQTRPHTCHWPGCNKQVPPAMWGCKQHWFKIPQGLRNRIWATYKPGQEITMTPSDAYINVVRQVEQWIKENT